MAFFKGYWMANAFCGPGATFVSYGNSRTNSPATRTAVGADILTNPDTSTLDDVPYATFNASLSKVMCFPRAVLASWWPGSGWYPPYAGVITAGILNFSPSIADIDYAVLDAICTALPTGSVVCTDVEYLTQVPVVGASGSGQLTWQQTAGAEAYARATIAVENEVYRYVKAKMVALGKTVTLLKYVAFPFSQSYLAGYQYMRDHQIGNYTNATVQAYATQCDAFDQAVAWAIANGAWKDSCDALVVDSYSQFTSAELAVGPSFFTGLTSEGLLRIKSSRDARLLANFSKPVYNIVLNILAAHQSVPTLLSDAGNLLASMNIAASVADGVIWHCLTTLDPGTGVITYPSYTFADPLGPQPDWAGVQAFIARI